MHPYDARTIRSELAARIAATEQYLTDTITAYYDEIDAQFEAHAAAGRSVIGYGAAAAGRMHSATLDCIQISITAAEAYLAQLRVLAAELAQ